MSWPSKRRRRRRRTTTASTLVVTPPASRTGRLASARARRCAVAADWTRRPGRRRTSSRAAGSASWASDSLPGSAGAPRRASAPRARATGSASGRAGRASQQACHPGLSVGASWASRPPSRGACQSPQVLQGSIIHEAYCFMLFLITDLKRRYQEKAFLHKFSVLAEGVAPETLRFWLGGGQSLPQIPPLNDRP